MKRNVISIQLSFLFFPHAFELITIARLDARLWYTFNGEHPPVGYFQTRLFLPRIEAKSLMKMAAT